MLPVNELRLFLTFSPLFVSPSKSLCNLTKDVAHVMDQNLFRAVPTPVVHPPKLISFFQSGGVLCA